MRRTKIVCTIGPACSTSRVLTSMLKSGMDVARLNFSHGTHEQHARVIQLLRQLSASRDRPLAILQDLSGPKIRLGTIACGQVVLKRGQRITLTTRPVPGDDHEINLPVPVLIAAVTAGSRLLVDDGRVELAVVDKTDTDLLVRAVGGGILSSRKGVTSPGLRLDIPAVTDKDLDDLRFGLTQGVDWIAASYVRGPADLDPLRAVMQSAGIELPIIAKIEKMEAVHCLDSLLKVVQGIMVARGDLGVEIPIDEVPIIQKQIIRRCNEVNRPVITATQMLESMVQNPRPTRAEVTDVANAILDGTDAVMLSGETAAGQYPVEAVRMMARVAERTDPILPHRRPVASTRATILEVTDAVAQAAVELAHDLKAKAILCATASGSTARLIARYRPETRVVAVTPSETTYRRLALTWGVQPILIGPVNTTDRMMEETITAAANRGILRAGDRVILTAGVPVNIVGNTNLIRVHVIGQPLTPRDAE